MALFFVVGAEAQTTKNTTTTTKTTTQTSGKMSAPGARQSTSAPSNPFGYQNTFKNEVDLNLSDGYIRNTYAGTKNVTDIRARLLYSYDLGNKIQVGGS